MTFDVYYGSFKKKDGSVRNMSFVKLDEIPKEAFPEGKGGEKPKLQEGMELVWDIENKGYRVINYNTLLGELVSYHMSGNLNLK